MKDAERSFMELILDGREPSAEEMTAYVTAFHERCPRATSDVMTRLHAEDGRTSYDILADTIVASNPLSILDIGCGDGTLLLALRSRLADAQLYGIDLAEVDVALSKSALVNDMRAEIRIGDAGKLPFPDASVDAITSHLVFMLLPNLEEALSEAQRVLRPGGVLALLLPRAPGHPTPLGILLSNLTTKIRRKHPQYVQPVLGNRVAFDPHSLAEKLACAGFAGKPHVGDISAAAVLGGSELWDRLACRYYLGSLDANLTAELKECAVATSCSGGFVYEETLRILTVLR